MKAILIIYLIAGVMAWAGSTGSSVYGGAPVFAVCAVLIFALQWLAFIPAYLNQSEKYYDLVGSLTYTSAILLALFLSGEPDSRSLLISVLVIVWAARLGSFLFKRISEDGSDSRFDKIKPDPVRFFVTWSLQGLWVLMTAGCALAAISSRQDVPMGLLDAAGAALWLFGFAIEVVADRQKRQFRKQQGSEGFIKSGLWAYSRHPNYLGEIILWIGIALLALPALAGWQMLTLVSPIFVFFLLTRISGIPMLERKADKRWGEDPEYLAYKAATPVLIPGLRGS
jgi:steroid 5-alpha reductase family enzyme